MKNFEIVFSSIIIVWLFVSCSTTENEITDIDGNTYRIVEIGDQVWMAENLRTSRYANGDLIHNVSNDDHWSRIQSGARCYYGNRRENVDAYGALYNGHAIDDARGLCPEGWRVPSDNDWKILEMHLGMLRSGADDVGSRGEDDGVGGKLKATGTDYWQAPNLGATNESGFTGLPGGHRIAAGTFGREGRYGHWWTSSVYEHNDNYLWRRRLGYNDDFVDRSFLNHQYGFSVRCIK